MTSDWPHNVRTVNDVLEDRYPSGKKDIYLATKNNDHLYGKFSRNFKAPYMPPARELMDGAHDTWGTLQIRIGFVRQSRHTNAGYH